MQSLARYRQLFALTGPAFLIIGFLARLPQAMSQIGTLLLVSSVTGSFGVGGLCAGALSIANACCAPIGGWIGDRYGQRWVLIAQSIGAAAGLAGLVAAASAGADWRVLLVVAAAAGALIPQVGTMARVRWRELGLRADRDRGRVVETAFAYEGVADELSFVLGPATVGLLAVIDPRVAMLVAAAMLLVFGIAFALHPTVRLTGRAALAHHETVTGRLFTPALVVVVVAMACMGAFFGSIQTGTTTLATSAGAAGLAGVFHALLGIGSVIAGLLVPLVAGRWAPVLRWRLFTAGLLVLALPLLAVGALSQLVLALILVGFLVAPVMITIFTLGEQVAPPARLTTAMTLINAMNGLGYALGAGLAGRLADVGGHRPAFAVTVGACFVGLLLAVAGGRWVRTVIRQRS